MADGRHGVSAFPALRARALGLAAQACKGRRPVPTGRRPDASYRTGERRVFEWLPIKLALAAESYLSDELSC